VFQSSVAPDQYRVIVYDARGHRLSQAPREPSAYSQQHMVDDLCGLMDHLGFDTAAVGGLPMGGNVGLNFLRTERVSALILADTGAGLMTLLACGVSHPRRATRDSAPPHSDQY
jgi:pimeloyl-ACP methyl ester carboxylesterase